MNKFLAKQNTKSVDNIYKLVVYNVLIFKISQAQNGMRIVAPKGVNRGVSYLGDRDNHSNKKDLKG